MVGVLHLTTPNHPAGAHGAMRCRGRAARTSLPFPNPAGGRARPGARGHTYIPPMETVAHVRSEKAGTVSVALLAGRM